MAIRKVLVTVVGHVDHGKTSLLDNIRRTAVTNSEAGAITQAIGVSIIPIETIKKICGPLLNSMKENLTVPGLLTIDTPGHAAFTSLRKRGGSLADIAILVVDINEGFKPQTIESIEILKANKVPFIVAVNKIDLLQNTVRIISGLYGILKPLDLVQPYRLEMGTKLSFGKNKNLYDYWKVQLTKSINQELKEGELFLNLASNEYIKAIDTKVLKTPMITANFKQFKNGEYKTIAIFSKRARGLMTRYVIDNKIESVNDLKHFSSDNYRFSEKLSTENELIFTR